VLPVSGAEPGPPEPAAAADSRPTPCAARIAQLRDQGRRVEPLIATLPDPLDSHFAREFDVLLAAMSRGLGRLGYVQDLHCLPWSQDPGGEPHHGERPGVVLFSGGDAVVAALLVGETPLAGVHARAMAEALRQADEMIDGGVERGVIRILGPTFSGSAPSINLALTAWRAARAEGDGRPPAVEVRIRSGSATVDGLGEILRRGLDDGDSRFRMDRFVSLTASNLDLLSCVWNRLVPERLGMRTQLPESMNDQLPAGHPCAADANAPDDDNRRVALLVESSAYGRDFEESGFHVVPFPMHMWRLRELYERERKRRQPAEMEMDAAATGPEVELRRRPRGIPAFGGGATLASQDTVLNGILHDLAERRFEVVGVVASDVMDKRFLVERIQALAPGSRIITFEGDVLLADSRNASSPAGVLVASSYPVAWPDSALGPGPGPGGDGDEAAATVPGLRFPLDAAQGVYFAVRELLSGESGAPPRAVWLSVIGKGDLHILERIPLDERPPDPADRSGGGTLFRSDTFAFGGLPVAVPPTRLPRGWWLMLSLVTMGFLVALAHVARCVWSTNGGPPGSGSEPAPGPDRSRIFGLVPVELVRLPRWSSCGELSKASDRALHALVALIPVVLGVPYFILSVPALSGSLSRIGGGDGLLSDLAGSWVANVPPLVILLLVCVILYLLAGLAVRTLYDVAHGDQSRPVEGFRGRLVQICRTGLPFAVTVGLTLGAVLLGSVWIRQSWQDESSALLIDRSLGLSSGASPLLPSLLLGAVLFGWIVLSLFRHRVRRAIPTREEVDDLAHEGVGEAVRRQVGQLRRAIDPASLWQRAGVLWTLLVAAPLVYLMLFYERVFTPPLRSVEGAQYDWSTSVLFVVTLVVTVGAGISLARGWGALRGLLEWLRLGDGADSDRERWLERVREAYSDAGDSRALAERQRLQALRALDDALERTATSQETRDLRERLEAVETRYGEDPAGRWLMIADWRGTLERTPGDAEGPPTELESAARDFFVWSMVRFIHDAFVQLLQLMGFMTVGLLFLLIAVTVYPFEPQRVLLVYVSSLVALGAALSVWVVLQARSDQLLGVLDGTKTSSWNLLARRLGVYAGLPAASILASRFPELRQVLLDWVAPLFKAFQ
jgi:hypothetical protein